MKYNRVVYTCVACDLKITDVPTGNIIDVKRYVCNLCGKDMMMEFK